MNEDIGLRGHLRQIFLEAIESHWATIEPYMRQLAFDIMKDKQQWEYGRDIRLAVDDALAAAIERHTATTFAAVVDDMAKAKVRSDIAKRLKARGLDTTILDSIP